MNEQAEQLIAEATHLFTGLDALSEEDRIDTINQIRLALHEHSPLKEHPVDCVLWTKQEEIEANAYNPNSVAPPEMALLERSISDDGYTQPIVAWRESDGHYEIVDGAHRSLVGRSPALHSRMRGRLPIAIINTDRTDRSDRMASTIRHDRARGIPDVELMKHIVSEIVEAGMSDQWIMKHIGMEVDELLRLKQITGLAALFKDKTFTRAWVAQAKEANLY